MQTRPILKRRASNCNKLKTVYYIQVRLPLRGQPGPGAANTREDTAVPNDRKKSVLPPAEYVALTLVALALAGGFIWLVYNSFQNAGAPPAKQTPIQKKQ